MFNEFSDKLNIRLVLRPKNLVFSFLKNICTGKKFKIRPTDTDLERKSMAYSHYYHLHYSLCLNSLILTL